MDEVVTVPVIVVTGSLGAEKTTLVNRWLADARRGDVGFGLDRDGLRHAFAACAGEKRALRSSHLSPR